jgi:exopolyphosphatase/pppGpp-phosphohydrolase
MAVAMQTLAKFRRLADLGVDEIIAAATSAVREAKNGGDFITRPCSAMWEFVFASSRGPRKPG